MLERRSTHASVLLLFRVEQVYKGDISGRVEVETERDGSTCGLELPVGERVGLLLEREGALWRSNLCSRVEPAAFLELTEVEDNALPPLNWGGIIVGVLILLAAVWLLARRTRRYRSLR